VGERGCVCVCVFVLVFVRACVCVCVCVCVRGTDAKSVVVGAGKGPCQKSDAVLFDCVSLGRCASKCTCTFTCASAFDVCACTEYIYLFA
jgi:hypothetical protein